MQQTIITAIIWLVSFLIGLVALYFVLAFGIRDGINESVLGKKIRDEQKTKK
ncbi:hypothetical protein [Candidatus Enterococcus clewellii]|uniref:Uncharacterized protein n=1 Tax=Candidatus Enterococcus clewellii TaxID=1834193 RepID=A0A242K508_9ENTE|nr:hypothetical protein [Enterococcus sp. 9E7_DIV0242]OTP13702.1 hypothetical protein A5888_003180 [Enterococcus sp. 9E7_DIV0242]